MAMTDEQIQRIREFMESPAYPEALKELQRKQDEEFAKAPKCFCFDRCDPPYGDGKQCNICRARPTAEDMKIIVY